MGALLFEARQWPEARRIALAGFEEPAPGTGQLQQANGVPGRCRIEDDVLVSGGHRRIDQQPRELIERCNFRGAGAGELFLDALDHHFGQNASHRPDNAIAVRLRGRLRVDFERGQSRYRRDGRDAITDPDPEHLPDVGGRIGAHEKNLASVFRQLDSGSTGDRGLAHAALASEEEEAGRLVEEFHGTMFSNAVQQQLVPFAVGVGAAPPQHEGAVTFGAPGEKLRSATPTLAESPAIAASSSRSG